ncbi:hypothetical protein D3C86_1483090 [compost metagenome]
MCKPIAIKNRSTPAKMTENNLEKGTLPRKSSTKQIINKMAAVEKLSLTINPQIITIGAIIGRNPFFQSFISSFFFTSIRDTYISKASFAKSEDWKVNPTKGIFTQRPASFTFVPKKRVKTSRAIEP